MLQETTIIKIANKYVYIYEGIYISEKRMAN